MPKRRTNRPVLISVLALLAALSGLGAIPVGAAPTDDRSRPGAVPDRADTRLASSLREVASGAPAGPDLAIDGGNIEVMVTFDSPTGNPAADAASIAAAGGIVTASIGESHRVEIAPERLQQLASTRGVQRVAPLLRPQPTAITSEGVGISDSDDWQAAGFTGAGVKVAIIDVGFGGYDSTAELPAGIKLVDYCTNVNADAHGTAVAEIVHDMAPDATLELICVDDIFDLATAGDYVVAQGFDVVNHSVAWFATGRGDGTADAPAPDATVKAATDAGILWVNAAGNYAEEHWKGTWNPRDFGDGVIRLDWGPAGNADFDLGFSIPGGGSVLIVLRWDAWPTTTQDLDMALYDFNSNELGFSNFEQYPNASAPTEFIQYTNPSGSPVTVYLEITEYEDSVTNPGTLDLLVLGNSGMEYADPAGSISEPASSPDALAVGAVCSANGALEGFSSQGPTVDGRFKPDIVSADGVSTDTFGPTVAGDCESSFSGTSASAPHVAGAAAQLLEAAPGYSVDQLRSFLTYLTLDRGSVGKDNLYGDGELKLGPVIDPPRFFDVAIGSTFYDNIQWLAEEKITLGCNPPANDLFCPKAQVTRGQMAAFLVRALDYTATSGTNRFTDDDGSIFELDIDKLATAKVTLGCNPPANTLYCPNQVVSRGQMAAFLVRALGLPATATDYFSDDNGTTFENDINALAEAGITSGTSATTYSPAAPVTREQMAAFLQRALTTP